MYNITPPPNEIPSRSPPRGRTSVRRPCDTAISLTTHAHEHPRPRLHRRSSVTPRGSSLRFLHVVLYINYYHCCHSVRCNCYCYIVSTYRKAVDVANTGVMIVIDRWGHSNINLLSCLLSPFSISLFRPFTFSVRAGLP